MVIEAILILIKHDFNKYGKRIKIYKYSGLVVSCELQYR